VFPLLVTLLIVVVIVVGCCYVGCCWYCCDGEPVIRCLNVGVVLLLLMLLLGIAGCWWTVDVTLFPLGVVFVDGGTLRCWALV